MATDQQLNMDKFFSRLRSESMYELRKITHQQRPVSHAAAKQALENFFTEQQVHVPGKAADPGAAASAAAAQSRMPEPIRLEVRGLFQRRRVREVLQSSLVQRLEQAIVNGLQRHTRRRRAASARPRTQSGSGTPPEGGEQAAGAEAGAEGRSPRRSPASPRRPQHQRQRRLTAAVAARSGIRYGAVPSPDANGRYRHPRTGGRRDQGRIMEQVRMSPTLNTLEPEARDRVVAEVGHLLQQQLVTSALTGEFRGTLELHIQERAERHLRGEGLDAVLSSLQRRNAHRATANAVEGASRSYGSTGDVDQLRGEVADIKAQLLQLKQMMHNSFDLQLDIQRSIRQEVAAAMFAVLPGHCREATPPAEPAGFQLPPRADVHVVHSGNCAVCSEASIDSMVYRCGHMCVCMACGLELKAQGLKCPICRAPITDIVRAYASMC